MRARAAGAVLAVTVPALAAWPFVEPHLPVLRRVQVPVLTPGSRPLRVLHLSDLHLLPTHTRRAAWVRALAAHDPHLVVSTGDHWSSTDALPLLCRTLGALTAGGAVGVFVPGNNDYHSPKPPTPLGYLRPGRPRRRPPDMPWDDAVRGLELEGWTDLSHHRAVREVEGTTLVLTGTDDGHLRRDRYPLVAGTVPPDAVGIGVTHTPAQRLLRAFGRDGHDLVLSGHTHGGQLRLPVAGALITNCDLPRWRARGLTRLGGQWLHVSAGLGTSPYLPVRLCCRPEATLLELTPRLSEAEVR